MRWVWTLALAAAAAGQTLNGVVDVHVHSDPDSMPRSVDAVEVARLARERGMRALLLKNHYEPTASLAWLVRKLVPGIEVFGGIALNRAVGGINPAAVERMTRVKGGWGRVVWMPTFDAEQQVRAAGETRPFVPVGRNGELLPEVREVLALMAQHRLSLATGHSSPAETLLLISEARRAGVSGVLVTHAMASPVAMNVEQMKQAAALGAYLEFAYNSLIGAGRAYGIQECAAAIRAVGPEHCIVASDLGQAGNPLHPDGLLAFLRQLSEQGFTRAELERMSRTNPAAWLGLAPAP